MKKLAPILAGGILALLVALVLWPEGDENPSTPPRSSLPQQTPGPQGQDPPPSGPGPGESADEPADEPREDDPEAAAGEHVGDAPPLPSADRGTGQVTDEDGRPLANASVWVATGEGTPRAVLARTDSEGRYPWPSNDTLTIVTAEGFAARIVPPGPPRAVILERARAVEGVVVDAESGLSLPEATIEAMQGDYRELARGDQDGRFRLSAPAGQLDLMAWAPGHVSARFRESDLPNLALSRGRGVTGRLRLPDGSEPGTARVWIVDAENLNRVHTTSALADGSFELAAGIAGASVWILAGNDRFATPLSPRWTEAMSDVQVDLAERGALLLEVPAGTNLDRPPMLEPTSLPEGAALNTLGPRRVDAGWRYDALAPGSYQFMAPSGPLADVEVLPGEEARLAWSLLAAEAKKPTPDEGGLLRARVIDRDGLPLPGASVVVSGPAGESSGTTDARGEVALSVPAGALSLSASARGRVLVAPVQRDGDDRSEVTLVLAQACVLHGQVFPNVKAELRLVDGDENELRSEHSDDAGRFRLEQVPAGDYWLWVGTETKVPIRVGVTLPLTRALHVHLDEDYGDCEHEH